MAVEDPPGFESYLHNENSESREHNHKFKLPEVIGILPIRNAVAYPGTVMPLSIGRERSKNLLADIKPNESIIGLVTQHNPQTDRPAFSNIYPIGTAASVLKLIKIPQGSINIIVHGIVRFKIVKPIATEPYLKAVVKQLDIQTK
ncbi:MAG: LON peptidase substrate-binding domain-containing protein, partial [Phycisphaerae bacterium]